MELEKVREGIKQAKVIAVIRTDDVELVRKLARIYVSAGIRAIELTTSIPDWKETLRSVVADAGSDALIGIGTVTSTNDAVDAMNLGARFIVFPFISSDVIELVNTVTTVPVIPGALTPSEVAQAYELGADMVKIFPVSSVGGPAHIKALLAPMPHWELIPTGGVTSANAIEYFKAGAVAVGLGTNLIPTDLMATRDWFGIEEFVHHFIQGIHSQLKDLQDR